MGIINCMVAKGLRNVFLLLLGVAMLASCSITDLADEVLNGQEERYEIVDKNSGTLTVYEKYAGQACRYEIESNGMGILAVEFLPDGHYLVTYDIDNYSNGYPYTVDLPVDGKKVSLPLSLCRGWITRTADNLYPDTGMYMYDNNDGSYHLMELNWSVRNGTLTVLDRDGMWRQYRATVSQKTPGDALTARLCHRWGLDQVLLKLYKDGKLVMSYQLTGWEMEQNCVSAVEFTRYNTFIRHDDREPAGAGKWNWTDRDNQQLYYSFIPPYYGSNYLTAYFAGNNFYMTEEVESLNDYDEDDSVLKAVCLYKMSVRGN
ncbi:MAG: hypothetical protein NC388_08050 [Clostridium sp.]|nr:hypothetical protein [Clostridium sp.]